MVPRENGKHQEAPRPAPPVENVPVEPDYPRVTKIIGRVMNKPELLPWGHQKTLEGVTAASHALSRDDFLDMCSDYDMLYEWMKENRMTPSDYAKDAADRGTAVHTYLEELARAQAIGADVDLARWYAGNKSGWMRAVGQFWLDKLPTVVASEVLLVSDRSSFKGHADLVWYREDYDDLTVTDLKSRNVGVKDHDTDHAQVEAYGIAWDEMHPDAPHQLRSVLLAYDDGQYTLVPSTMEGVFLNVLEVYTALEAWKEARKNG